MKNDWSDELSVAELMKRYPQVVPVFIRHRLACIGCSMAAFELLRDVPGIYHLDSDAFLMEIKTLIEDAEPKN